MHNDPHLDLHRCLNASNPSELDLASDPSNSGPYQMRAPLSSWFCRQRYGLCRSISDNELSTVNLTLWLWFCCDSILLNLNYLYRLQGYEDEHLHPDYYRLMLQEQCRLWLNTGKTDCYTQISGDGANYAVFTNKSTEHVLIKKYINFGLMRGHCYKLYIYIYTISIFSQHILFQTYKEVFQLILYIHKP